MRGMRDAQIVRSRWGVTPQTRVVAHGLGPAAIVLVCFANALRIVGIRRQNRQNLFGIGHVVHVQRRDEIAVAHPGGVDHQLMFMPRMIELILHTR
jgi:hypothetical protein